MQKSYSLDGVIVSGNDITFNTLRRGFLYGDGIFETLRAYNFNIFRWNEHWERLKQGAQLCDISLPEPHKVRAAVELMLERGALKDAYVRISFWRKETESFDPGEEKNFHSLVEVGAYKTYGSSSYSRGIECCISEKFFKNEHSPLTYIKSFNYLENLLARKEARSRGCQESILLNTAGYVTGASVANVFMVKAGAVYTPSVHSGILEGITRKIVLDICRNRGIDIFEGLMPPAQIAMSDEVFLTNSIMQVMPVRSVAGLFKNNNFEHTSLFMNELEKLFLKETNDE